MSELKQAAGRPPLSYSLPAFHSDDWRDVAFRLEALCALGFRHVVFHPTWPVTEDLRIGDAPSVLEPFRIARSLGFSVRLEPHLDYASSLAGGPYRWRRDMLVDPLGDYFGRVLMPMASLGPDELTLGSELDFSADAYGERWELAAYRLNGMCALGHKLNHDWLGRDPLIRYLRSLDYVALSWYLSDWRPLPRGYVIGEMGLGSTDVARPWHFDASTFRDEQARALRRRWYLRLIEWVGLQRSPRAAAFWTAGHFDVLGVTHPQWRDDSVVEAVREYQRSFIPDRVQLAQ